MRWASAVSSEHRFEDALASAGGELRRRLGGVDADLLLAFVSHEHHAHFEDVGVLREVFPEALLAGCSAGGVIGGGRELEDVPGVALCAARLPGVEVVPLSASSDADADAESDDAGARTALDWAGRLGSGDEPTHLILLADPLSFPAEPFLGALDRALPHGARVGGLASGGQQPGENALFLDGGVQRSGVVGVALRGALEVDTVVAQGCRPVGHPLFVTRCRGNLLLELDGRAPVEVLNELYARGDAREQALFRSSLLLGIEMEAERVEYGRGDFLVRNLVGADADSGALVVAAPLHEAQVVQFHVRDARTAAEDLEERLAARAASDASVGAASPAGALLFSCLGRGRNLYGVPDHDSGVFRRRLGDVPLAGFFCNGEIGPVAGRTFLHGYTSAFGLFRPPADERPDEAR